MWYNQPMKKLTPNTNETPEAGKPQHSRHFVTEGKLWVELVTGRGLMGKEIALCAIIN